MAENKKTGDVDVAKVTEKAEKIARGDAPKPEEAPKAASENQPEVLNQPEAIQDQTSKAAAAKPQEGQGDQLADKLKQNNQKPITQGAPGALKPGQTAATNKPVERISEDEAEQQAHEALVADYGPDYVTATKAGEERQFSRRAWDLLGPAKADGSKEGWKPAVKVPAEVKAMQKKENE